MSSSLPCRAALLPTHMRIRFRSFYCSGGTRTYLWNRFCGDQKTPPICLPRDFPPSSHTPKLSLFSYPTPPIVANSWLLLCCRFLHRCHHNSCRLRRRRHRHRHRHRYFVIVSFSRILLPNCCQQLIVALSSSSSSSSPSSSSWLFSLLWPSSSS